MAARQAARTLRLQRGNPLLLHLRLRLLRHLRLLRLLHLRLLLLHRLGVHGGLELLRVHPAHALPAARHPVPSSGRHAAALRAAAAAGSHLLRLRLRLLREVVLDLLRREASGRHLLRRLHLHHARPCLRAGDGRSGRERPAERRGVGSG